MGKKTKAWAEDRKKLLSLYLHKGITRCEAGPILLRLKGFNGCWKNNALNFAHRHKRHFYLDCPELLGSFNQTILACNPCHDYFEYDRDLTEEVFNILRGEEVD